MNTNIEELYKKKYLKYKAKYLNIQRGGVYSNGVNDPRYQISTGSTATPTITVTDEYYYKFKPQDMALDADGNIVVSDLGNHCLHVFNRTTGVRIRIIGKKGNSNGEFSFPHGIAFDGIGNIVVADLGNSRVQVLKYIDGSHVSTINNLEYPNSVAIKKNTEEYMVLVHCKSIIKEYNLTDGTWKRDICTEGTEHGQLRGDGSIIFDRQGNIVVADSDNNRVEILNYETGAYIKTIGDKIPKKLFPRGIALDATGNIIVTCSITSKMYIYRYNTGEHRFTFDGTSKMDKNKFDTPWGVVIDNNGSIIVSDRNKKNIRTFRVGQNLIIPIVPSPVTAARSPSPGR